MFDQRVPGHVGSREELEKQRRAFSTRESSEGSILEDRQVKAGGLDANHHGRLTRCIRRREEQVVAVKGYAQLPADDELEPSYDGRHPALPGDEAAVDRGQPHVGVGVSVEEVEWRQQ